ncbi:TPA: DNA replication terminus site-binding protein [Salmonella enterica subsp. enterica serovar Poona]
MCRDIQNLSSLLLQLLPRYANAAAIPTFCKRYGKEPINRLVVTGHTGRKALGMAVQSYRDPYISGSPLGEPWDRSGFPLLATG